MEPTLEPDVFVTERGPERVVFWDTRTGERWAQLGSCDCRGLCQYGAEPFPEQDLDWDGVVGHPCRDRNFGKRPEIVNRPESLIACRKMAAMFDLEIECGFTFEWLEPWQEPFQDA